MPKYLSFELTTNNKAIKMSANDAALLPSVDYDFVYIPINSVDHLVIEKNEIDGLNVVLTSGQKHTIKFQEVSQVGANDYSGSAPYVYPDMNTFITDLIALVGW